VLVRALLGFFARPPSTRPVRPPAGLCLCLCLCRRHRRDLVWSGVERLPRLMAGLGRLALSSPRPLVERPRSPASIAACWGVDRPLLRAVKPISHSQGNHGFGRVPAVCPDDGSSGTSRRRRGSRPLAVSEARLALADFDQVTIRIAKVAAGLAVLFPWLRDKLSSSTSPQFIGRLNVRDADIHKAAD
jgi:hypothetical protein